ncbi:MAG: glycosyltransferase family 2 protein [Butyrivibrio sp.]|nr:glycosyltransferase family 2 protein [Butyrivibrio sp.]
MGLVTVIIPNFNGKKYLSDCLKSLAKQSFTDFDVIIVDDGSTDGSAEFIMNNYPFVKVIELKENTGFANAANTGIMASDSPYVFLLNNDTMCDERAIERLVRVMENKKKLFSAQAKMLQMKEPHNIDDCGDLYCALGWAFTPGKDKNFRKFSRRESITSTCAGAAIYRKEYFEKVGYFDQEHFCYLEDVDLGYRARLKGYANVMEPTAIVYHVGSASSGSRYNAFKVELTAGNNLYLIYKNMPVFQVMINFPLFLVGIVIKHAFYVKHGLGKAHIKGLISGVKKIASHPGKRVIFGKTELVNALRLQIELWVNLARRALSI